MPNSKSFQFVCAMVVAVCLRTVCCSQEQNIAESIPSDTVDSIHLDSFPLDSIPLDIAPLDSAPLDSVPLDSVYSGSESPRNGSMLLPSESGSNDVRPTSILQEMTDYRATMHRRSTELDAKLDRLEQLLKNHPACKPANAPSATPVPANEPPQATPDSSTVDIPPPQPTPAGSSAPAVPSLPTDANTMSVNVIRSEQAISDPEWDEETSLSTIIVTDNVVNRLALANNLYAAGEVKLALRFYNQLRQDSTEPNQEWVTYQIAQCHRTIGDKSNADRAFRIVTAMPNSGRWGEYSKWWLSNGDEVAGLRQKSQQLTDAIESLRSEIHGME